MDLVRCDFEVVSNAVDVDAGIYDATIMTGGKMRNGNVIVPGGGLFASYLRNPVVPWSHAYDEPPVAKCVDLTPTPESVVARFQFVPMGTLERADQIHKLWRDKYLNAVSIGIWPIEFEELEDDGDSWWPPLKFTKWEMLEFSIVTIPNNPETLRLNSLNPQEAVYDLNSFQRKVGAVKVLRQIHQQLQSLKEVF